MRIGKVVGNVVLSRGYSSLMGGRFLMIEPEDRFALQNGERRTSESLVAFDQLGAGIGDTVAFTESGEASAPFLPEKRVPIDALTTAILDEVYINPVALKQVNHD